MEIIKVGFVDDQRLFRVGFARVLKSFKYVKLLSIAESGEDLFLQIAEKGIPDIILIDLDMPGLDGIKVAKILRDRYPEIKLIILTGHDDNELILRLLQDGFCAYLHKDAHEDEVERAIYEVFEKGSFNSERAINAFNRTNATSGSKSKEQQKNEPLTPSEIEIIKLICKGYKDVKIAYELNKGLRTVQNQRLILRKKIGAETVVDIINYAIENGLVEGAGNFDYKKGRRFSG